MLRGHVLAFAPGSGAQFALLPPDNATGNFTKVVQRVAVKIAIDDADGLADRLRPGMSVVATGGRRGDGRADERRRRAPRRRAAPAPPIPWLGLTAVLLGTFISTLNGRLSTFGLADIRGAVHAGFDEGAWITTAQTVAQMLVAPVAIWLGGGLRPAPRADGGRHRLRGDLASSQPLCDQPADAAGPAVRRRPGLRLSSFR